MPNWQAPDAFPRLIAAMIAANDCKPLNYNAIASYYGRDATYDAVESRFRGYRREAQNLYNEVQSGARPVLAARAHPRNRNKASGGRSTAGADGGGSRARAGGNGGMLKGVGDRVSGARVEKAKGKGKGAGIKAELEDADVDNEEESGEEIVKKEKTPEDGPENGKQGGTSLTAAD